MVKKKQSSKKVKVSLFSIVGLVLFVATAGQLDLSKVDFQNPATWHQAIQKEVALPNYSQLSSIPTYDGKTKIVQVNENIPGFFKEELDRSKGNWETFTQLDGLNRVGQANAMLHKSMAPKEKRGDISKVYPTGWKQKKLGDKKWLYNRSHLIGYRFTGQNDNWKNLFTGTEQMNQESMVVYEDQVATYLRETGHHVRYRVTPYFTGTELVPRGVQMEAKSIEDTKLSFNVYIYNVIDGYEINYTDGSSKKLPN